MVTEYSKYSKYPEIIIDHTKCTTPFDCKKCLRVCPQAVLQVYAVKVEKYKETDKKEPGAYRLMNFYIDKCTMCGDCIEVCPVDAIKILPPRERASYQAFPAAKEGVK